MRQKAVVLETNGKIAVIEVSRASMCEGCQNHGGCGGHCELTGLVAASGKMKAKAVNGIGAVVGDTVEVETGSGTVLGYAALVFLLPIVVCGLFYFLSGLVFASQTASVIGAAAGFVLTFAGIAVFDRVKRKSTPDIRIVNRIS